jgi:hypothetical protein
METFKKYEGNIMMSSIDDINKRRLLLKIENDISIFLRDFIFEIPDELTKNIIKNNIAHYMEILKSKRIFYDFSIDVLTKSDRELDWIEKVLGRNMINDNLEVKIYICPTKSMETIQIDFKVKK